VRPLGTGLGEFELGPGEGGRAYRLIDPSTGKSANSLTTDGMLSKVYPIKEVHDYFQFPQECVTPLLDNFPKVFKNGFLNIRIIEIESIRHGNDIKERYFL